MPPPHSMNRLGSHLCRPHGFADPIDNRGVIHRDAFRRADHGQHLHPLGTTLSPRRVTPLRIGGNAHLDEHAIPALLPADHLAFPWQDFSASETDTGVFQVGEVRPGEVRPGEVRPGEVRPGEVRPGEVRPERFARERSALERFALERFAL
jgi:hypothetical protein